MGFQVIDDSVIHSEEAFLNRVRVWLKPILNEINGIGVPQDITIIDNQLCINGTPVGNWQEMSNFRAEGSFLCFDYAGVKRSVAFGFKGFDKNFYDVFEIYEIRMQNGQYVSINVYERR